MGIKSEGRAGSILEYSSDVRSTLADIQTLCRMKAVIAAGFDDTDRPIVM